MKTAILSKNEDFFDIVNEISEQCNEIVYLSNEERKNVDTVYFDLDGDEDAYTLISGYMYCNPFSTIRCVAITSKMKKGKNLPFHEIIFYDRGKINKVNIGD